MANEKYYGKMITVEDSAKYLNVTKQTIYSYIKKGYLTATNLSYGTNRPIWGINESDLVDFDLRKHCIKRGRKKGSKNEHSNKNKEIKKLKKRIKKLSEELFEICCELEAISE